jgi:SAM-dependent methyltransferase
MEPEEYDRLFQLENELWWFRGMADISMALVERFLPEGVGPSRVLDVGCGTGGMLERLRRIGPTVGIDAAEEALALARKRSSGALVRGDASRLPFHSGSFDLLTSFDVLYHSRIADDAAALAEMARVLRPGGTFLVRVPAFDRLRGRHDAAVHTRHRYGKRELDGKLRAAGFHVLFLSFVNCFLFPVALLRRGTERFRSGRTAAKGSEVEPVSPLLNEMMLRVLRLERQVIRFTTLPVGLSLVAVGRKEAER